MSKKRAGKSKRRREQQRAAAAGKEPHLVLISNTALKAQETTEDSFEAIDEGPATARSGSARNSPSGIQAVEEATPSASEPAKAEPAEKTEEKPAAPAAKASDLEEDFFSEGRIQTPHAFVLNDELLEAEPPKPSPKMTPAARARRAHFSKYVKGAMVGGVAILALAGIRVAVGHADRGPNAAAYLAAHVSEPVAQARTEPLAPPAQTVATTGANTPAAEKAPPPIEPTPATEKPVEPAKTEPAAKPEPEKVAAAEKPAVPEAAKAEPAKAEPAKAEPAKIEAKTEAKTEAKVEAKVEAAPAPEAAKETVPAPATGKAALQEKQDAQRLLERGKAAAAIEAAERSVAIDATDGEAWLILGAAYQEKGNLKDARRAFTSCTKEGKRGPISECKAMLR